MTRPSALSPTAVLLALLAATLLAIALLVPARADARVTQCPTFRVLHNDQIGKVQLPKGTYKMKVLDDQLLSCKKASKLFARFLSDFDGKLGGGWRAQERQGARRTTVTFTKRHGPSFRVRRGKRQGGGGGGGGGGGHFPSGKAVKCPTFEVLHNDQIAGLRFPKGTYQMTALGGLTCSKASGLFRDFLADAQGTLPGRWRLKARSGTFLRGNRGKGFQVNLLR
jgi:hypothetical protein